MRRLFRHSILCLLTCLLVTATAAVAQPIHIREQEAEKQFPNISLVFNRIFNSYGLDSFYLKLYSLKKTKKGTVSVVHIGDSHVQSGYLPDAVKNGLQEYFGSAGRGTSFSSDGMLSYDRGGDTNGVVYHTRAINGARFETFNKLNSFWEQLPSLHADLYIISLGTNDAQAPDFNESAFEEQVTTMLDRLRKISPHAAILITTAADSFKQGYPNRELWSMNIALFNYCTTNSLPVWDLYRVTNGYGSAYNWIKRGMMDGDGVHYTGRAYQLQGQLLFYALAKGYNNFISGL